VEPRVDVEAKARYATLVWGTSPHKYYTTFNNNLVNLKRGVVERIFLVKDAAGHLKRPPQPALNVHQGLQAFSRLLDKHSPSTTPVSGDVFVSMYRGRKRVQYQQAWDSLKVKSVERKDAFTSTFGKLEKHLASKPGAVQRVIQPRGKRYNVMVGRYIKPIEEQFYKAVARVFGEETITKGMNASTVGLLAWKKWSKFKRPVAVGLDAKRFDQHCSVPILEWEHERYLKCFHGSDRAELARLLRWQLNNRGYGRVPDGVIKYVVRGCRMSGDMNTALGNCVIMCSLVWTYMRERRITMFELMNNGDDCVVIMERSDLAGFAEGLDEWFRNYGFNMQVEEPVYVFEELEFCQCRPVLTTDGYRMVRNVATALAKDSVSVIELRTQKEYEGWVSAVGDCGLSLCRGVPVMESFYRMFCRVGSGRVNRNAQYYEQLSGSGMAMMARGMRTENSVIDPKVRVSFARAFGITVQAQFALEAYYDQHDPCWKPPSPEQNRPTHKLAANTWNSNLRHLYLQTTLWERDSSIYAGGYLTATKGCAFHATSHRPHY